MKPQARPKLVETRPVRPRTRVRFPPPPLKGFQRSCDFCLKRRQIGRRLCAPSRQCLSKHPRELVKLDVVGVKLRRVNAGMTQQPAERRYVTAALTQEPIRESMPQLMWREIPNPCSLANALHHP